MNKFLFAIGAIALLGITAAPASAGQPSAKTSVVTVPLTLVDEVSSGENTDPDAVTSVVMATQLKTGNADLLISVSVECGVFLRKLSKSKKAKKAMKKADANVVLTVKVDGEEADPGPVTFCDQEAKLSASLSGTLATDEEVDLVAEVIGSEIIADGIGDDDGTCELDGETLGDLTDPVEGDEDCIVSVVSEVIGDEIGDDDGTCELDGDTLGDLTDPVAGDEVCAESETGIGDEDGICEEGESCQEVLLDDIGDDDGVCEVTGDTLGFLTDPVAEDEVCDSITLLGTCLILNEDTGQIVVDEECLSESEIELVLASMNANAFFFVKGNVRPGVHVITVEATIDVGGKSFDAIDDGLFEAKALVGKGTVVVEQVRLVKGLDGVCDDSEEDPDCI